MSRTKAGSVSDLLVKYYQSDVFKKGLATATQKTWRAILERFREFKTPSGRCYGENSIATIKKKSITDFLSGKTANSQKNTLKPIGLIKYAIGGKYGYRPDQGDRTNQAVEDHGPHDMEAAAGRAVPRAACSRHRGAVGDGVNVEHRCAPGGCTQNRSTASVIRS